MAKGAYVVLQQYLECSSDEKSMLSIPNVSEIQSSMITYNKYMHKVIFFHYRIKNEIEIPVYMAAPSLPTEDLFILFSLKQKFKVVYARLFCILNK